MQFYLIEKKTKNILWDWYDYQLKILSAPADVGIGQLMTTCNKQTLNFAPET